MLVGYHKEFIKLIALFRAKALLLAHFVSPFALVKG